MSKKGVRRCSCGCSVDVNRFVGRWWRVVCDMCGRRAKRACRSPACAVTLWNREREGDK